MVVVEAPTPLGPARLHIWSPESAAPVLGRPVLGRPVLGRPVLGRPVLGRPVLGRLVLGHGAGGGIESADLAAVRVAVVAAGWQVVLVEQPWRVAGKRIAPAPARLDIGWSAALTALLELSEPPEPPELPVPGTGRSRLPLVLGGRSAGARVACRTATSLGAGAVCALAFPLHPPGRPERSRAAELAGAGVPVLVVQGLRDPFGTPAEIEALGLEHVEVLGVTGDHALSKPAPVAAAVVAALSGWCQE